MAGTAGLSCPHAQSKGSRSAGPADSTGGNFLVGTAGPSRPHHGILLSCDTRTANVCRTTRRSASRRRRPLSLSQFVRPRAAGTIFNDDRAAGLIEAVRHRHEIGRWWCRVFVAMPDHVHGLIRFPSSDHPMKREIADFKKFTARTLGIRWQRDFFDHRLRREESEREKADYILRNPERAGLVDDGRKCPYCFVSPEGS